MINILKRVLFVWDVLEKFNRNVKGCRDFE